MKDKFTKADLKDGMVIEQYNKYKYLVIGDRVIGLIGFNPLSQYNDDLTNELGEEYGVEKVYGVKNRCVNKLEKIFDKNNLELIWEHTETKSMTTEEMRKKLEELTGEKIEVEPSREEMIGKIKLYCTGQSDCTECILSGICERCNYWKFEDSKLKQCYEKVMEDG